MVSSVSPSPVLPDFESHDEHEVQNNSSDSPEACFTRLSLRATAHPSVDLGGAKASNVKRLFAVLSGVISKSLCCMTV
jgi:hypothetical protein